MREEIPQYLVVKHVPSRGVRVRIHREAWQRAELVTPLAERIRKPGEPRAADRDRSGRIAHENTAALQDGLYLALHERPEVGALQRHRLAAREKDDLCAAQRSDEVG